MEKDAGMIILHLMYDTLAYSKDSLRTWLKHLNTLDADLWLLNEYIDANMTSSANQLQNEMIAKYPLSALEQNSLSAYRNMLNFLVGKSKYALSTTDLTTIGGFASGPNLYTKGYVENILSFYGAYYPPNYELPEIEERNSLPTNHDSYTSTILVFPNPIHGNVAFIVPKTESIKIQAIKIFNISGMKVFEFTAESALNSIVWQNDKVNSGIYYYHVALDDNTVQTGKITVIK